MSWINTCITIELTGKQNELILLHNSEEQKALHCIPFCFAVFLFTPPNQRQQFTRSLHFGLWAHSIQISIKQIDDGLPSAVVQTLEIYGNTYSKIVDYMMWIRTLYPIPCNTRTNTPIAPKQMRHFQLRMMISFDNNDVVSYGMRNITLST